MFNKRGQNTAEYAILIALVIGAAVAMQTYVKGGLQGRVRDAIDHTGMTGRSIGDTTFNFTADKYEPDYTTSQSQIATERSANESLGARGSVTRSDVIEDTKVKAGGYEHTGY